MSLTYDNRFVNELPGDEQENNRPRQVSGACWSPVTPTPVSKPKLLAYSEEMLTALGLSREEIVSDLWVEALSGNRVLEGMRPYSMCYGGNQFGNWAGQLGDGRAINLGEVSTPEGHRWVLQLKGAGPTPYSRRADGRAVLRSSIREFICSEAMHHLGVPTTRALSLVGTGDQVVRDMFYDGRPAPEPGAIVCRVSPSFVRFGSFEIFAARGEDDVLRKLVEFVLSRDYPHLEGSFEERVLSLFVEVCERTARMIDHWMRVGFVHGVMNTDNMSILGLTIDYGPYGWIDNYDPNWTPNTTDLPGRRYRFGHQPQIGQWNLLRLANALAVLLTDPQRLTRGLERYVEVYEQTAQETTYAKFGLQPQSEQDDLLMGEAYQLLEQCEVDMTLFFRLLSKLQPEQTLEHFEPAFYQPDLIRGQSERWKNWIQRYGARAKLDTQKRQAMDRVNPLYVPRNYLLQEAIEMAEKGDLTRVHRLLELFRGPYTEQPGADSFAVKRPDWAKQKAGCSMLSCSS